MKCYSGKIKPGKNIIYCYGSNTEGRHGKGAALIAKTLFGAIYGQSKGLQGNSYAIITKDLTKSIHPSISKEYIIEQIEELYLFAVNNPIMEFHIAYRVDSIFLNSYSLEDMVYMFARNSIPVNIVFEDKFYELIRESKTRSLF